MIFCKSYSILILCAFGVILFCGLVGLHAKDPVDLLDEKKTPSLKLKMQRPSPHAFTYSPVQDGTLYAVFSEKHNGYEFGPILIWRSKEGGLVDIGNLSSLDEILRTQVFRLGSKPDRESIMKIAGTAIGEYVRLQTKGQILTPFFIESFLAQIKSHVSEAVYERLKKQLVYPVNEFTDENWVLTMFVLTADWTIEFNRFSGSLRPFSIKKRETEVIVEAGVIPKLDYIMPSVEEWEKWKERQKGAER